MYLIGFLQFVQKQNKISKKVQNIKYAKKYFKDVIFYDIFRYFPSFLYKLQKTDAVHLNSK